MQGVHWAAGHAVGQVVQLTERIELPVQTTTLHNAQALNVSPATRRVIGTHGITCLQHGRFVTGLLHARRLVAVEHEANHSYGKRVAVALDGRPGIIGG